MHGLGNSRPGCGTVTFAFLFFFSAFGVSRAQDSAPALKERSLAAETFVAEKLAMWQQRLNLKNWNLTVRLVPASELKPKTLGNIHWDTSTRTAGIAVLSLADYSLPFDAALRDMEFTVVHELVHLQLSSLPRSEASRGAEERAVNQLTGALLKLARRE